MVKKEHFNSIIENSIQIDVLEKSVLISGRQGDAYSGGEFGNSSLWSVAPILPQICALYH